MKNLTAMMHFYTYMWMTGNFLHQPNILVLLMKFKKSDSLEPSLFSFYRSTELNHWHEDFQSGFDSNMDMYRRVFTCINIYYISNKSSL